VLYKLLTYLLECDNCYRVVVSCRVVRALYNDLLCWCVSFRRYSDEDMSRLGMTSASSVALSPSHTPVSLRGIVARQQNLSDVDVTSFLECLKNNRPVLQSQMDKVVELKVCGQL